MNKNDMLDEIGSIRPEFIEEARPTGRRSRLPVRLLAAAAALVFVIGAALILPKLINKGAGSQSALNAPPSEDPSSPSTAEPAAEPSGGIPPTTLSPYPADDWLPDLPDLTRSGGILVAAPLRPGKDRPFETRRAEAAGAADTGLFTERLFKAVYESRPGENTAFSPASVYLTMAMLAEASAGNTRAEILNALGVPDMNTLRQSVIPLIKSETNGDLSRLATAFFLAEEVDYKLDILNRLAGIYGASSFSGDPSDDAYTEAFREWLSDVTGSSNVGENTSIDPNLILSVCSAIRFKADWTNKFGTGATLRQVFYTADGIVMCETMRNTDKKEVFLKFDGFSMARRELNDAPVWQSGSTVGYVWFILPDEGLTVADIDLGPALRAMKRTDFDESDIYKIVYSVPRFVCRSEFDLVSMMKKLGIRDCFDENAADFSPLTDTPGAFVKDIPHLAQLAVVEGGIDAIAFTHGTVGGYGVEVDPAKRTVYFTLDHPFLTFVTGASGEPLFIGSIADPTK